MSSKLMTLLAFFAYSVGPSKREVIGNYVTRVNVIRTAQTIDSCFHDCTRHLAILQHVDST